MITNDLLKLARAMVEFEGWHYPDAKIESDILGSASWRNHNPGNLRVSPFAVGTNNGFAVFVNDEVGFNALVWDLWKKSHGETSTGLNSQSTIYQLIEKYSGEPPAIVIKYARFIELKTGFSMTMKIGDLVK